MGEIKNKYSIGKEPERPGCMVDSERNCNTRAGGAFDVCLI